VNRGLIEHAKDADCILGVIAHEAGHVKYRHCIQSMVQSLGITLVFYLVFDFTGGLLTLQGITKSLLELQYSREMESEADLSALKLLQNSGIREDGMVRFLKSMKEDLPNLPKELEFFSSHPHSESRIDLISKELPKTLSHTPEEAETLFKKIKSYLDAKE
jgi:Zn-dependent protease with chaperone function